MSGPGKMIKGDTKVFKAPNYDHAINFQALANVNKDLKDCLVSNHGIIDFKKPDHLRCLTKALLLRDFKLQLYLPENRLCPPVPIRWLYVQWIQNLMDTTSSSLTTKWEASGLDIGVGASCIYPLLACATRPEWKMYGTDIDETNFEHAVHNVSVNEFDKRVKLLKTIPDGPLIPLDALGVERLDFAMCNPPFFASKEEAAATFLKEQQPFAACTGVDVEMITPGGEVAYTTRMVHESVELKERLQWYTVQLGKLSSLHAIVQVLKDVGCQNWVVNVLQPSGHTVRWVIGWSWAPWRAPDNVARHKSMVGTGVQMEPNERLLTPEPLPWDPHHKLTETLNPLEPMIISWTEGQDANTNSMVIHCDEAVWTRRVRRKRQREEEEIRKNGSQRNLSYKFTWDGVSPPPEYAHIFAIDLTKKGDDDIWTWTLNARWLKGEDRAVFESFCGLLKTKITAKS